MLGPKTIFFKSDLEPITNIPSFIKVNEAVGGGILIETRSTDVMGISSSCVHLSKEDAIRMSKEILKFVDVGDYDPPIGNNGYFV